IGLLIGGSGAARVIVKGLAPGMLKAIAAGVAPGAASAARMAWRKDPGVGWLLSPLSAVVVTKNELDAATATASAKERAPWEVTLAVTLCPEAAVTGKETLKRPLPDESVMIVVAPRYTCAWPSTDGSPGALEKNSIVTGALSSGSPVT